MTLKNTKQFQHSILYLAAYTITNPPPQAVYELSLLFLYSYRPPTPPPREPTPPPPRPQTPLPRFITQFKGQEWFEKFFPDVEPEVRFSQVSFF